MCKGDSRGGARRSFMRQKNIRFLRKRVGAAMLALLLCFPGLSGCGKKAKDGGKDAPTATPGLSVTSTATPTPTPTPAPWKSYEKIGDREVYRVPVPELTESAEINGSSSAGDYLLLQVWEHGSDVPGPQWGKLVLLKPAQSGEGASLQPDYAVSKMRVLKDGTVITVDSPDGKVHVYDAALSELRTFSPLGATENCVIDIAEDGSIWAGVRGSGNLVMYNSDGEQKRAFLIGEGREVFQYLGESGGCSYFRAFDADEKHSEIVLGLANSEAASASSDSGDVAVIVLDETVYDLNTCKESVLYSTEAGMIRHNSNETWYLHRLNADGHWIAFPQYFDFESIDMAAGDRFAVRGFLRGQETPLGKPEPGGVRICDFKNQQILGELTTLELGDRVIRATTIGLPENGPVYLNIRFDDETSALYLWDISDEERKHLPGCLDLTEKTPEQCLANLWEEYKEAYGIVYTPSELKALTYEGKINVYKAIDMANVIARGVAENPSDFPRDEEGIALRLENIRGHERGHSVFNPHVMTELNREEYGDEMIQTFYNLVDAIRAGEEWFDASSRFAYNWSVSLFSIWFYPVASGCIKTSYDYRNADEFVNNRGRVYYTVSPDEVKRLTGEFEQMVCDMLDDCIADDYTDFEKALALYEFMTEYCVYDYDTYWNITNPEVTAKAHIYRCFTERTGICWALSGMYDYLLLQAGVKAEEVEGHNTTLEEDHAWSCVVLDGQGYYVDVTWGLTQTGNPSLGYFCFTDDVRANRDNFPLNEQQIVGYEDLSLRTCPVQATDRRYEALWDGRYVGMDRAAKKVIYLDRNGVLRSFSYGN